jgi:hypothetical protein
MKTNLAVRSRASATALSIVLRATILSHGNTRFSGTDEPKPPHPIKMKCYIFDNVGEVVV